MSLKRLYFGLAVVWLLISGCRTTADKPLPTPQGATPVASASATPRNQEALQQQLLEAAARGDLEQVKESLSQGADVNGQDAEKRSALMLAGFDGHTEVVAHLLDNGANTELVDANGRTALMFASSGPFPQTVKLLLEKGANANATDSFEGWTALMFAAGEGQVEVCQALLEGGADKTIKDQDDEQAIDHAKAKNQQKVVELLE